MKLQGKIHTISTVSFSPIESLPIESEIDFIKGKDKDKDKEREKDRIKTAQSNKEKIQFCPKYFIYFVKLFRYKS